jgi:hypothetical protein
VKEEDKGRHAMMMLQKEKTREERKRVTEVIKPIYIARTLRNDEKKFIFYLLRIIFKKIMKFF